MKIRFYASLAIGFAVVAVICLVPLSAVSQSATRARRHVERALQCANIKVDAHAVIIDEDALQRAAKRLARPSVRQAVGRTLRVPDRSLQCRCSCQSVLEDGTRVPAETCRRLACDASGVVMRHDPDGRVVEIGARTRTTRSDRAAEAHAEAVRNCSLAQLGS